MEDKSKLLNYFIGLSMGQVYAYIGIVIGVLTFFGGKLIGEYLEIDPAQVDRAFYSGVGLWLAGTGMHIWKTNIEANAERSERREADRSNQPASFISLELARTLPPEGMTIQQISDDLAPHANDSGRKKDSAIQALTRLRIREASADGTECFYHNGRYYPRTDSTIISS